MCPLCLLKKADQLSQTMLLHVASRSSVVIASLSLTAVSAPSGAVGVVPGASVFSIVAGCSSCAGCLMSSATVSPSFSTSATGDDGALRSPTPPMSSVSSSSSTIASTSSIASAFLFLRAPPPLRFFFFLSAALVSASFSMFHSSRTR